MNRQIKIRRTPPPGFTLLELVVVMAILAIISATIAPVYVFAMDAIRTRNAQRDLMALIRYAQEKAVHESREYRVYFNKDTNAYRLVRLAGLEDNEKVFELADSLFNDEEFLPKPLIFSRIEARRDRRTHEYFVSCLPNGSSDKVEIQIRDERSRGSYTNIIVEGPLGKITLEEHN